MAGHNQLIRSEISWFCLGVKVRLHAPRQRPANPPHGHPIPDMLGFTCTQNQHNTHVPPILIVYNTLEKVILPEDPVHVKTLYRGQ